MDAGARTAPNHSAEIGVRTGAALHRRARLRFRSSHQEYCRSRTSTNPELEILEPGQGHYRNGRTSDGVANETVDVTGFKSRRSPFGSVSNSNGFQQIKITKDCWSSQWTLAAEFPLLPLLPQSQ